MENQKLNYLKSTIFDSPYFAQGYNYLYSQFYTKIALNIDSIMYCNNDVALTGSWG